VGLPNLGTSPHGQSCRVRAGYGGEKRRSAYNAGIALALWDSTGTIRVLVDGSGIHVDVPLNYPGMIRLKSLLINRRIVIRIIPRADCPRGTYVARQIAVKTKYRLWVAPAEKDAMAAVLGACPEEPLPVDDGPEVKVPAPLR
jgi:hypothetical protein